MPCSLRLCKPIAGHFGPLVTLVVEVDGGGVGGHEDVDDESGGGDDVKFLCLKNSCSSHTYDNDTESIMIIDFSRWEREEGRGQLICT